MEEYNYKFAQNCSILTLNGVTNLVSKIRVLHKSANQNEFNKHYKYLREQCISPKHSVASSAMLGLIHLTQEPDEVVPLQTVVKDIMSTVPNVQNMSGIIDLIFHALFKSSKVSHYDIMKNQHPLITVLKKNPSCWPHILCKIEDKFKTESKSKVLQRLQPFVLFVLYDYEQKLDQILQVELLKIYMDHLDNISKQKILILNMAHIPRSLRYCRTLIKVAPHMLTYAISAIYELLTNDEDATEAIWILHQHVANSTIRDNALEIVMTADCLAIAPITAMDTLCDCINTMLYKQKYPTLVTSITKASLLSWKMHFATNKILSQKVSSKIDAVLSYQFEHNDSGPASFVYLDEKQFIYSHVIANELSNDFLDSLQRARPKILEMLFVFLLGLFNDDNDTEVTLKVLRLCLKTCKVQVRYTTRMLPVLLQKISSTVQPEVHLELMRALPALGVLKENLSTIVMTIKAISGVSSQMHSFALSLMYDLVLVDKICFPYLEELLAKDADSKDYELILTKSFLVMELCCNIGTNGLDNYRKEMASFVSKALMRPSENNMVVAQSFEALKYLCRGFDPYQTMVNLSQKFENDTRDHVIAGMCGIMGEVPGMPDVSSRRCEEVVRKLFYYAETIPSERVLAAVYTALNNFSMEHIAIGFPTVYTHITNDNSILGSLAGACWVNLLQFGPRCGLRSAADMLIRFIDADMRTYCRANYEVMEGHGEPLYMALTRDNILGAVAKFTKKNSAIMRAVDKQVYRECMRILSTRYLRPLPPMDWAFLNELKDCKDLLEDVVRIAARQSSVSGSARRFCETFIKTLTDKNVFNDEVIYVYNNLDMLCNTIQPVIMKPFFKKTLKLASFLMERSTKEIDFILGKIEVMLRNPAASESNKNAVADVLISIFDSTDLESETMIKVLPVIGSVPRLYLNEYSPVQFEVVNDLIMLRCLAIHCAMATAEDLKPLITLDSVIDCRILKSCVQPAFNFEKMLMYVSPVFERHHDHISLAPWLTELTSRINIELAERKDMRNVIFSSTMFIIAVVVSSGYHIFANEATTLDDFSALFPYGLRSLLERKSFTPHVPQILESLYDITTNPNYRRNVLSDQITRRFKHGLLLMRAHESFNEKFAWMKYIEVNF